MTERPIREVVDEIKRTARLLSREACIPHRQALDMLAKKAGHSHWGSYLAVLTTGAEPIGWRRDGVFSAYPPLMRMVLARSDVNSLALNADGSAWVETGDPTGTIWSRLAAGDVDDRQAVAEFLDTIPMSLWTSSNVTYLIAGDSETHHSYRMSARRPSQGNAGLEITIRRGPSKDGDLPTMSPNWGEVEPDWTIQLLSSHSGEAIRKACDIAIGERPSTTRLVTFGVRSDARRHPNHVEAYAGGHDENMAIDYAMRVGGDAFVAMADTPERAARAVTMARANHGPMIVLVDAEPEDVVTRLTLLAHAGNVSSRARARQEMAGAIEQIQRRHVLHD